MKGRIYMEQANLLQAMKERHSVRSYLEKPIDPQSVQLLRAFIDSCNRKAGCTCSWS